jgi:hypothetical protein
MASRVERSRWPAPPVDLERVMVAAGLILLLLASGYAIYQLQFRGLSTALLGLCAACLGLLVIIRPAIGLLAMLAAAVSLRVTIGTGTDSPIVASLVCACILIVGWVAHRLLHRQRLLLLPSSVTIPGLLLACMAVASLLWGRATLDPRIIVPDNFYRVQLAQASLYVVAVGLLFVGADQFRSPRLRTLLMIGIIAVGVVGLPFRAFGTGLFFLNTAGLFGLWFVALCWSNALLNRRMSGWLRIALGALALSWLLMAIVREGSWVSGWLPEVLALLAVTLIARPRVGIVLCLLFITGVAGYYSFVYELLITQQESDGSLGGDFGRLALWTRMFDVIQDKIWFGTGPAGYALYYITFVPRQAMSTHSNYIDVMAQMGVVGVLAFAGLLLGLWRLGRETWDRLSDDADRAFCAAVLGALPALAFALWLGDWLVPFVYNQTIKGFDHAVYSWVMLAALCGLYYQHRSGGTRHGAD